MSKTKEKIIIPQRNYAKYKLWTKMLEMYEGISLKHPEMSNNAIYAYIGAYFEVSISTVINAISRCTETTAVTLTRE